MQYRQRRLHRSVTEMRRLRSGRPRASMVDIERGVCLVRLERERQVGARSMTVVIETVLSEVLKGNALGDPHERRVPVCLPPDYENTDTRYPVVYFLAGFGGG